MPQGTASIQRRMNYQTVIIVILMVTSSLVFYLLRQKDSVFNDIGPEELTVGQPAPDFTFPGLDGKMISLSDTKGKVVLVNIWATWCPPCVDEMPSLQTLYQAFKDENFEILAVSIDSAGLEAVAPFMQKHKLTFPALIASQATMQSIYKITGVPDTFIIDKEGILIKKIIGPLNWSSPEVFRLIRELLREPLSSSGNETKLKGEKSIESPLPPERHSTLMKS
jgi:peroxiredoxin